MITQEISPVSKSSFCRTSLLNTEENKDNSFLRCESTFKHFLSITLKRKNNMEDDDNSALVPFQQDQPWLQTCGDRADLCAGEAIPSPGKEDYVPPVTELSAMRHVERNSGTRRNKRKYVRKQRKKSSDSPELLPTDALEMERNPSNQSQSSVQNGWQQRKQLSFASSHNEEDSFLTDDEAEVDEDDQHNIYINRDTPRYSSRAQTRMPEGGDSDYRGASDVEAENCDWFHNNDGAIQGGYHSAPNESCEDSDDHSDSSVRTEGHTPRLTAGNVLPAWMRVPCVGKDVLDFSSSKKDVLEEKKSGLLKNKKKRKKSKNVSKQSANHPPDAGSSSEENLYPLSASGLKHTKTAGPAKWFRRGKISKNAIKLPTCSSRNRSFPMDCMQIPAPEGSILKRPLHGCLNKPKKKVRWASDLMQVRYFRSEPAMPSRYFSTPRRQSNRISSYDLDVLLFPWQDSNHASYDNYMHFIQ